MKGKLNSLVNFDAGLYKNKLRYDVSHQICQYRLGNVGTYVSKIYDLSPFAFLFVKAYCK